VGPAVVPGQDLAEVAGPVRDGAVADLTARMQVSGSFEAGRSPLWRLTYLRHRWSERRGAS